MAVVRYGDDDKLIVELIGTTTDEKPTTGIGIGSTFTVYDDALNEVVEIWLFTGTKWVKY